MLLELSNHNKQEIIKFETAVSRNPFILSCDRVAGQSDYLLHVAVPDIPQLGLLTDWFSSEGLAVGRTVTIPIIAKTKKFSGYPIQCMINKN